MSAGYLPPAAGPATLEHVLDALGKLDAAGLSPCLFGGWAKELHGVWRSGAHADIDILVTSADLAGIDAFLVDRQELIPNRHVHKRGWWHEGVLVELFHVRPTADALVTHFYGGLLRPWLLPLACSIETAGSGTIEVVTPDNIIAYERDHPLIQDAFYTVFPDVREEMTRLYGTHRIPYSKYYPTP